MVHLNKELGVSHQKISRFFNNACHLTITRGGVSHVLFRVDKRCGFAWGDIIQYVRKSAYVRCDETSWKVGGDQRKASDC
jgi:hypothetical protein